MRMYSLTYFFHALCLTVALAYAEEPCELACDDLSRTVSDIYLSGQAASVPLWSEFQARVQPLCRLEARHSEDVAAILGVLRHHECHFAVLGGGTSPFKGASNAAMGVTIDMRKMKNIKFVDDSNSQLNVGAGSLWADVYRELHGSNMSATGTRNSLTGVIGSILGGGISFFSERHGWSCDTTVQFELVLANSTIVRASETFNSELFWALKGGGNNFGIVTRVTIETFRDPPRWYTFQLFSMDYLSGVFDRLERHTNQMPSHVWQIATTLGWHVPGQHFVISERMVASERPELVENTVSPDADGAVTQYPVLQTNVYQRSILSMAQKMDGMNAYGYFNFFGSVTVRNNAEAFSAIAKIFQEEVATIKDAADLQIYIVYNPLTLNAMAQMRKHGGNALGLSEETDALTVVNINLHWSNESEEPRMRLFMQRLIRRFRESAAERGMLHRYIFQNHAFEDQDVFPGYGEANLARLKAIRQSVDPDGVLQKLQPGFFKLAPTLAQPRWVKSEL